MAHPSSFLLGLTSDEERPLEALLDGPVAPFFALAQRVVWGVSQADLVRVNVPAALRTLESRYPQLFATQLLKAFACALYQPATAAAAVERARTLCPANHPWRHLLPASWPPANSAPELTEVIAGQMWRVHGYTALAGTPFEIASTATVVRDKRGDLTLINPCKLDPAREAELEGLGRVRRIVTQGRAHSLYVDSARRRFAGAKVLGTRGHLNHPQSAHLRFDGLLGEDEHALGPDLAQYPILGTRGDEVVLLHRPTRTLILQDQVTHALASNRARGFGGLLYSFGHGLVDRIGWPSYQLILWNRLDVLQHSLRALLDADFARIVGAHWPLAPCDGVELEAFRSCLEWAAGLSPGQHWSLKARYFARQPGFLWDLVRYASHQRRVTTAAITPSVQAT